MGECKSVVSDRCILIILVETIFNSWFFLNILQSQLLVGKHAALSFLNESELAIIDFEIQPIISFNFLCILLFWVSLKWLSLEPYALFWWGFQCDIALRLRHALNMKTEFLFVSSSDSFCLIASHKASATYNTLAHILLKPINVIKQDWAVTNYVQCILLLTKMLTIVNNISIT